MFRSGCEHFYSPPFDTINDEYRKFLHEFPCNITHITLPKNLEDAKATLDRWIAYGTLIRENEAIILLKQKFESSGRNMERYGIMALVKIFPDDGSVIPHEKTFSGPRTGRYKLMKHIGCIPEPIFLVSGNSHLRSILQGQTESMSPVLSFTEPEGVLNEIFLCIDRDFIEKLRVLMEKENSIVADGHHRLAALREIASEVPSDLNWHYAMAYITPIDQESLMISGIHRIIGKIKSKESFLNDLKHHFTVEEEKRLSDKDITLYMNHTYYRLSLKREYLGDDIMDNIPPNIVNRFILDELKDLNGEDMEKYTKYTDKSAEAIETVDKKEADACILMPVWDKELFQKCISERKLFPQKSTFFFPKVPSGIALYIPMKND